MRSHAKASTAGSTQRQVKGLGRLFGGSPAARGVSLDANGSSASAIGLFAFPIALAAAFTWMAIAAGAAFAAAPAIPTTTVSSVTTKTAVLEADINPEGEATNYHFEYGLADCASSPCTSVPAPSASAGSGSTAVRVSREVKGLTSGTTYHFRVVASNGSGGTPGPDRTLTTYDLLGPPNCANEAFRIGAAVNLADCRAYEMVSPVDKNGGDIATSCQITCLRTALNQASTSGNKFTYSSYKAFGNQVSGHYSNQYLATRGPSGWTTDGINAPQTTTIYDPYLETIELDLDLFAFSEDLSSAWLRSLNKFKLPGTNGLDGYVNLYRRDNATGSFEALTVNPPFGPAQKTLGYQNQYPLEVQGMSRDGTHVIYSALAPLTPDASVVENSSGTTEAQLYDFHDGQLELVSVLPDGEASSVFNGLGGGPGLGRHYAVYSHAVSDDGSRIFWTAGPFASHSEGQPIYVRIDGEETVTVSPDPANFWTASTDGAKALISKGSVLGIPDLELLLVDVDSETSTPIAGGVFGVLGASDDLSYIYLVSREDLDAGATLGERNVYLYHEGTFTFIATVSDQNEANAISFDDFLYEWRPDFHSSRVTPDGRHAVFESHASLAGYDNTDARNDAPAQEVYIYDADADELICASCNPSGARPLSGQMQSPYFVGPSPVKGNNNDYRWAAAWLPTAENAIYKPRSLAEDGDRVFFNAFDALVPQDNNGVQDVYEWRAQGVEDCQKPKGCVSLISTGESQKKSEFVDATPGGDNVFFETESSIHPEDPGLIDIYDARVGGGYPYATLPAPCVGDACQNVPPSPNDATPASASFKGAGDPKPRKPRVRCRARNRKAAAKRSKVRRKAAKRCTHAKRRAGR